MVAIEPQPTSRSFGIGMHYRIVGVLQTSMPLLVILALGEIPGNCSVLSVPGGFRTSLSVA